MFESQSITQSLLPSCAISLPVLRLTPVSDLFIHVNPILNGWLQSVLFTVLNEELLLLSRQPVFLFLPTSELQSEGEFNLYENASALQVHSPIPSSFRRFPSSFHSPFSSSSIQQPLKGKASDCSCNDSLLERTFRSLISHKCMLTTAWQSTWKCLLQASAQLHKTSSTVRKSLF